MLQRPLARLVRGPVELTDWGQVLYQPEFLGGLTGEGDRGPVLLYLPDIGFAVTAIAVAAQFVGQIDHEAGVSSRRAPGDALRIDDRDALSGSMATQLPGRGQAGKAGPHHQPVGVHLRFEPGKARAFRQHLVPAAAGQILRKHGGAKFVGGHQAIPRSSSRSARWGVVTSE